MLVSLQAVIICCCCYFRRKTEVIITVYNRTVLHCHEVDWVVASESQQSWQMKGMGETGFPRKYGPVFTLPYIIKSLDPWFQPLLEL